MTIDIPCKMGDKVWGIRNYRGTKHAQAGIVSEMCFTRDMELIIVIKHVCRGTWGDKIFATYEEAVRGCE